MLGDDRSVGYGKAPCQAAGGSGSHDLQWYIEGVTTPRSTRTLPEGLHRFFWDVDADRIDWSDWREFIIGRLLRSGDRPAVQWLLSQVGEADLARWLHTHRGGGLSPQRLRYWQLMLDLPEPEVDAWIARTKGESWGSRVRR